jgi:MoaA/NifB/PqqE/SkfB family radical SAM enzyme
MLTSEQRIAAKKVKKAVWWITLSCNLKCPYCLAPQLPDPLFNYPIQLADRWIEAWNRIEGEVIIDISGGEPLLQPGFIEIINSFDSSKKIAMTTNLTQDMTEFVQKVSPEKCINITASLHISNNKMNVAYFVGKLLMLKNRGFNVAANFVAFPEQMWLIDHYREMFAKMGLHLHIDPYLPGPSYPFKPSEKEKVFLERNFGSDRDDYYDSDMKTYVCDAGMNYFVVSPNGVVSTCVGRLYKQTLGNIFDSGFRLYEEPMECSTRFCSGCDVDKVVRTIKSDQVMRAGG